jgi:hypothetical protein
VFLQAKDKKPEPEAATLEVAPDDHLTMIVDGMTAEMTPVPILSECRAREWRRAKSGLPPLQ